jgi:hypothetical protein
MKKHIHKKLSACGKTARQNARKPFSAFLSFSLFAKLFKKCSNISISFNKSETIPKHRLKFAPLKTSEEDFRPREPAGNQNPAGGENQQRNFASCTVKET